MGSFKEPEQQVLVMHVEGAPTGKKPQVKDTKHCGKECHHVFVFHAIRSPYTPIPTSPPNPYPLSDIGRDSWAAISVI